MYMKVLLVVALFMGIQQASAQCFPTGPRPITGTINGATGTQTFTNVLVGNVIQITPTAVGIVYTIDMCATNPAGSADGLNDSYLTMIDFNGFGSNSLGFADDGCTTNVPQGWGPTLMTYSSPSTATSFLYVTEYDAGATDNCIFNSGNNAYDITITWGTAGPCEAGTLNAINPQNVCPGDSATISATGALAADGNFAIGFDSSPGGTGANGTAFNIINILDTEFPYTFDNDFNGVLSANMLPPMAGAWSVKIYAFDAAGLPCDSTAAITVNFLDATDPLCAAAGFDAEIVTSMVDEYTSIPLSQIEPILPYVQARNSGSNTVTNLQVTSRLFDPNDVVVYTANYGAGSTQAAGAVVDLNDIGAGYTPTALGLYLMESVVSIAEADGDITNDTLIDAILITDSLYSRDFAVLAGDLAVSGALGIGALNRGELGNTFEVVAPTTLISSEFFLNGTLAIGDTVRAKAYTMAGAVPGALLGTTDMFIVTAVDTPVGGLVLAFNPPLSLGVGNYLVAVEEFYNVDNVGCLTSLDNFVSGTTLGQVNGGAWANIEDLGVPEQTFLVRANLYNPPTATCMISSITSVSQTACNPANNTYTQTVQVTYTNAPASGMLTVNGQNFAITGSPQNVTLTGLISNGASVNVTANFSAEPTCTFTSNNLFTAPASCACNISALSAGTQTACNTTNNTYTQQVTVTYTNAPASGMLNVAGQMFAIGSSPQTVTLTGLDSDNNAVNVTASFTANAACTFTQNALFTAPVACQCVPINLSATTSNETCQSSNGAINLTATGGTGTLTYSWSPGGAVSQDLSGIAAGNYTVVVTDANLCTETAMYSVTNAGTAPVLSFSSTGVTNCMSPNGTATVTSSNPIASLVWSPSGQTSATATGLSAGTHSVTVTDNNGCTATGSTTVANATGAVSALLDNTTNVTCNGLSNGIINITISGGSAPISYTWSDVGIPSSQQDRTGLPAGSYTVIVTDANSCSFTLGPISITQPPVLNMSVTAFTTVSCNGANDGTITVSGSGGTAPLEYSKDGIVFQGSGSFTGLAPNNYIITVRDGNGCTTASPSIPITQPMALNLAINGSSNIDCNGDMDGSISSSASGGTSPLTYSIDGGITTQNNGSFMNLNGGLYTVLVTDANGCTDSEMVSITEAAALSVVVDGSTNIDCLGENDGTISVTATGGTAPLNFSWGAGNPTTEDLDMLSAGNYQLTVTDANGCTASTATVTITEGASLTLNTSSTPETSVGNDGSATVVASGGALPYTYSWSPSLQDQATASGLIANDYTVTVTDANGCAAMATVTVDFMPTAINDISITELSIYPNPTNGLVTLSMESMSNMSATFKVISPIGATLQINEVEDIKGAFTTSFDLSQYASGIYFIEISNEFGQRLEKVTLTK